MISIQLIRAMPVYTVKCASDVDARVPPHFQRISISDLNLTSDCVHRSVKGEVVQRGPVVSCRQRDHLLKAVIRDKDTQSSDSSQHTSINVIFLGTLAKDFSQSVSQGDIVLLSGFTISKSPTEQTDRLHPCLLEMSSTDACVHVYSSNVVVSSGPASVCSEPRYTYVPLSELKPSRIVNVYGVVTFFKQPFRTKGTDYCSTLKIIDQTNVKVSCTIFTERLEDHPKVFQIGDIIRLHRVKTQTFNGSMTLLTTLGWSTITFDGMIDGPLEPRTSSRTFHFGEADKRTVESLRQWAAGRILANGPSVPLSSVQPRMFFDLTCQLLAKASMDTRCMLLKVWDGTKCAHPLLNVAVAPDAVEGGSSPSQYRENMIANVLIFDNHVEGASKLKPGMFLRLYNLHAVSQRASEQSADCASPLCFHLHGGTSYGKGLCVLPSESLELQPIKRLLESHVAVADEDEEVHDVTLLDVWYTPPEALDFVKLFQYFVTEPNKLRQGEQYITVVRVIGESGNQDSYTVRTCGHTLQQVSLAQVKTSTTPVVCHVRAKVKSYQPQNLYQCLKLFCPQCTALVEVPNDEVIAQVFQDALRVNQACSEHWAVTSSMDSISMHVSCEMVLSNTHTQLLFLQGVTLDEMCVISAAHSNMVPVRSDDGRMRLLDFSAPFLFHRDKRYYGCKQCSRSTFVEPEVSEVEMWDEHNVAKALGVQLMQYALLIIFELEDETGTLEASIWEDAEKFFHVTAADTSACQDSQDTVQATVDRLFPPGSSMAGRPWLDLCLKAYTVEENGRSQVCYQITNTEAGGNSYIPSEAKFPLDEQC